MKLQVRFLLLLGLVFAAGVLVVIIQHTLELNRSRQVLAGELSQRKSYFNSIVALEGRSEQTLSEDYSFWDDMVSFVKTGNLQFAQQNLDTGLSTFNVDADWVYRPDNTLVYHSAANPSASLNDLHLSSSFFKKLKNDRFEHFYLQVPDGILEVRAATIVPSDDSTHATPAQGYWVIGRFLSAAYVKELASLAQSQVKLEPGSATTSDVLGTTSVSFGELLRSWDGQPVAVLSSTSQVQGISDLNTLYSQELLLLALFGFASIVIVAISIWWLILRPVGTITASIKQQQPEALNKLSTSKTEFGSLSQTIQEFFRQKVVIQEAEFKKAELEKLNKEKAAFLAVAAHELNNPIANVRIFTDYLTFLLKKKSAPSAIKQQLDRIGHQVVRMSMLVNDLRAASQGKAAMEFNRRDFAFDTFLKEAVEEAGFTTKQKLTLEGTTGQTVNSDIDRLGQVMTNLIRNASKYSPDADKIIVRSHTEENKVIVEVQDFGLGISEADQQHIFERFFRSSSVTGSYPGLGLGLSICKQIIEQLGGELWVHSQLGKGSSFYFSVPVKPAGQPPSAPPAEASSAPSPG